MSKVLRAATSISAWTLASRILGLVRDVVMLRLLGAQWAAGTFLLAWMFPNLLRRLLGEGALSASFIPAYAAKLDAEGGTGANRLLAGVTGVLIVSLSMLSISVAVLCAVLPPEWVGHASASGATAAETGALLLHLVSILFPYVVLVCLVAVLSGALNAHGVFGVPAAMPILLNCFWLGGLGVGAALFAGDQVALTTTLAVALVTGGIAQLGVVGFHLWRRHALPAPRWPVPGDPARRVFAAMAPTAFGMSMLQLNTLLDQGFAYYLIDAGAPTHVYMANRLLLFPHALTALALATAVFPDLAVRASRKDNAGLRSAVERSLRATTFLALPASAGLMLVAGDLLGAIFVGGEFTADDAEVSTSATLGLVAGLPFIGAVQLYARALYAQGEMRWPARVAAWLVPLNVALNLLLVVGLDLGVTGLTLATTTCSLVNMLALRRRFDTLCPGARMRWRPLLGSLFATAVMAAAVAGVRALSTPESRLETVVLHLAAPIAAGIVTYLGVQWWLGNDELRRLIRRG